MLSEVADQYGFGPLSKIHQLSGGEWNDVCSFSDGERRYVLRIAHPNISEETLNFTHQVMESVDLPEVNAPLKTLDGKTYIRLLGKLASVMPFIEGDNLRLATPDPLQAGFMLGQIHQRTAQLPIEPKQTLENMAWDRNFLWDWDAVQACLSGPAQKFAERVRYEGFDLTKERNNLHEWVQSQTNRCWVRACMHGDYHPGNLIFNNGKIKAVIDWDEARVEWTFWEVGRAMWEFCQDYHGEILDSSMAKTFLHFYRLAKPPEFDLNLLGPVMRYTRLVDVLWDLTEGARTGHWSELSTDYHMSNLFAMRGLRTYRP